MTLRTRQVIVAAGLAFLAIGPSQPGWDRPRRRRVPSRGPSPTGSIGSGPATFVPSDDVSPLP